MLKNGKICFLFGTFFGAILGSTGTILVMKKLKKIAEKENIYDDIDLIKYMEKHNDDKVKFFMSLKKQKQIYTINNFKLSMLPSIDYIKLVDGYYKGYMHKLTANISEVFIIKNNKGYFFTFVGDYTEQDINEFINTVIIE